MDSPAAVTWMQISMPVSKTSPIFAKPNGFTLIELLIVIAIIGMATAAIVLTLPGRAQAIQQDAESLATRLSAARDQAVIGGQPVAIWVGVNGYGFEARRDGEWLPITQRNLANIAWRGDIQADVADGERMRIAFDNTGLPNQGMEIILRSADGIAQISVNDLGEIDIVR